MFQLCVGAQIFGACAEYAERKEVEEIRQSVLEQKGQVKEQQSTTRRELLRHEVVVKSVLARQAATETAFVQMGKGFNVLSGAVEDAYGHAEEAIDRQRTYERSNDERWRKTVPEMPRQKLREPLWWYGSGQNLLTKKRVSGLWLSRSPEEIVLYTGSPIQGYGLAVEEYGQRLYASDQTTAVCLDLLDTSDPAWIVVADCRQPMLLYNFRATDSPDY